MSKYPSGPLFRHKLSSHYCCYKNHAPGSKT